MTVRMIFEAPPVSENQALHADLRSPPTESSPDPTGLGTPKKVGDRLQAGRSSALMRQCSAWRWPGGAAFRPQERQTEVVSVTNAIAGGTAAFRRAGGKVIQRIGSPPIRDLNFRDPVPLKGSIPYLFNECPALPHQSAVAGQRLRPCANS